MKGIARLLIVGIVVFLSVCSYGSPQKKIVFIPTVDVYKVKPDRKVFFDLDFPARVRSVDECTVRSKVSGTLLKKFFNEGSFVKKGQVLFEIDPSLYAAEVNGLKAQLELANAKLNNAKVAYERIEKSFKENLVSAQKRDNAFFEFKQAEANVDVVKAQLDKAQIYLRYTKIKAPISGFISESIVDVGNYVDVGTSLVKITKLDPVYVDFSMPDEEFLKYKSELKPGIDVSLVGYSNIKGKINFVGKTIDPNTATVKLRAVFRNRNNALVPNEFVRIKLKGIYVEDVVKIPQRSVIQVGESSIVYVIHNGKVAPKKVSIIKSLGEFFLVRGLKKGDFVAYDNLMKLKPQEKVKIGRVINK
jgi:membrane fusion protein (multidrug efflux system)